MKRRSFLALPALLPGLAYAEQPPLVGVLRVGGPSNEQFAPVFKRDMARLGLEEGRDYRTQYAFAEGSIGKLPALAADLVKSGAHIIVPFGNAGIEAAQEATKEITIVGMADDLVAWKLVASMARPGGNTTGVSVLARKLGLSPVAVAVNSPEVYDTAVSKLASEKVDAVQFLAAPSLNALRGRFMNDMARLKLPALYEWPETVEEGGLIAYGPRITLCYRHLAVLISRVLKGAKPADPPIEQPSTFVLALNTGAARKIGLTIPETMLLRADLVVD